MEKIYDYAVLQGTTIPKHEVYRMTGQLMIHMMMTRTITGAMYTGDEMQGMMMSAARSAIDVAMATETAIAERFETNN